MTHHVVSHLVIYYLSSSSESYGPIYSNALQTTFDNGSKQKESGLGLYCLRYSKNLCKTATLKDQKLVFNTNYHLMQVKSIAEHSAIPSTLIKLPFFKKIFVLSTFERPLYTGYTV